MPARLAGSLDAARLIATLGAYGLAPVRGRSCSPPRAPVPSGGSGSRASTAAWGAGGPSCSTNPAASSGTATRGDDQPGLDAQCSSVCST